MALGVSHRLAEVGKQSPAGDTLCRQCVGLRPIRVPLNQQSSSSVKR
ncbi:hypothetical protein Rcae01_01702 [Novipirellula caenicola]|uniref:Uncharacterized protein n=1 Tax=Novipirellula caenicola TaxID=1536901 RepID=A0ABP9VM21_9BACT